MRDEGREIPAHLDLVGLDGAASIPDEQRNRAWLLAVNQELRRCGDQRVGDIGHGQRHPGNRRPDVEDRGPAHEEVDIHRRLDVGGCAV